MGDSSCPYPTKIIRNSKLTHAQAGCQCPNACGHNQASSASSCDRQKEKRWKLASGISPTILHRGDAAALQAMTFRFFLAASERPKLLRSGTTLRTTFRPGCSVQPPLGHACGGSHQWALHFDVVPSSQWLPSFAEGCRLPNQSVSNLGR